MYDGGPSALDVSDDNIHHRANINDKSQSVFLFDPTDKSGGQNSKAHIEPEMGAGNTRN